MVNAKFVIDNDQGLHPPHMTTTCPPDIIVHDEISYTVRRCIHCRVIWWRKIWHWDPVKIWTWVLRMTVRLLTSIQKTQVQTLAESQCLFHQISPTPSPSVFTYWESDPILKLCGAGVGHRLAGKPVTLTSLVPRPHPAVHVEESLGVWATPGQYC